MNVTPLRALCCGALLASAIPALDESLHADPVSIQVTTGSFQIESDTLVSVAQSLHSFGTMSSHWKDPNYPVHISSGYSSVPGWSFFISFDFSDYDPEDWIPVGYDDLGMYCIIQEPGDNPPISGIAVVDGNGAPMDSYAFDFPNPPFSGQTFGVFVSAQDAIDTGEIVTLLWNQVPAPGALAALGFACLLTRRRLRIS